MTPLVQDADFTLHVGDVRDVLRELEPESVHCVVTSPPYWGLRDYGATGQLGLEPTPEEYVANMVEVFREVRRVLRPDGTCWVNLGDSYNANQGAGFNGQVRQDHANRHTVMARPDWLKPKDLVGIPWRVAFALQQPYEHHAIRDATDRAWMAGLMDGEGCVSVVAVQPTTGLNESHSMRAQIRMADAEAVERVVAITGMSTVTYDLDTGQGNRPAQQWKVSGEKAADVLADIYPWLTVKRRQAIVGWNLQRLKDGIVTKRGQPIPQENMEKRRLLHDVLRKLNQREPVDIPSWCREPFVETESGWYLRSDVIWSKPNPMPESVTDRPTKAHEYVFLLTKSPRYFFDQEAVREAHSEKTWFYREVMPTKAARETPGLNHNGLNNSTLGTEAAQNPAGRNIRSVWEIPTQSYPEAHFATYPEALVERCLKAGCPEQVCGTCGKARERIVERSREHDHVTTAAEQDGSPYVKQTDIRNGILPVTQTLGFTDCGHDNYRPGIVLDPFLGSGTTALVARRLGRHCVGIELSPEYAELAAKRLQQLSLLA